MLTFFKWYQEWLVDCDYTPTEAQKEAMRDAWNGAIETMKEAAQQSVQADETICSCPHDAYVDPHKPGHCIACGLPFRR